MHITLHQHSKRKINKKFKCEKLESRLFVRRLRYFIMHNADKIFFEKLKRGVYGYYDNETHEIIIDYRKEIIPTLIHEFTHHIHKNWSETKVEAYEKKMLRYVSSIQSKNLIKLIGKFC